jgi:Flp pilus assembly pilin Flp
MKDNRVQDMIEYALMAGFVVLAAAAIMPNVADRLSMIFSKVAGVVDEASEKGKGS